MNTRILLAVVLLGIAAIASSQGSAPMPDKEWKAWLQQVRPLMLPKDDAELKMTAPSQRAGFREAFWQARNPNPGNTENAVRTEYEERARTADTRFRYSREGRWNDCGRTWMILGSPEKTELVADGVMPSTPQPRAENTRAETWTYRRHPRLPNPPETLTFVFDINCEAVDPNLGADRVLRRAAASYLRSAK
jgi:GWxTD domain-containing protein